MPAVNAANFHQPPVQRVSKPDVHGYFPAGGVPVPAVASNFIAADPPEEGRLVRIGNMLQVNPSFSIECLLNILVIQKHKSTVDNRYGEKKQNTLWSRYPDSGYPGRPW